MNYIRETIEYLRNYDNIMNATVNLQERLMELEAALDGYKAIDYSGMPKGGSTAHDDRLCNLIFNRDRTLELLNANLDAELKIKDVIDKLDEETKKILVMAYIQNKGENKIMSDLSVSRRTYYRMKNEAIRKLAVQLFGIRVVT